MIRAVGATVLLLSGCTSACVAPKAPPIPAVLRECPVSPPGPIAPPIPRTLGELTRYVQALEHHDRLVVRIATLCRDRLLAIQRP